MSDKPIPETDEEANRILNDLSRMRIDGWSDAYLDMRLHAEKLERERDESKSALKALLDAHDQFGSGASLNHPRLTMGISAARKILSPK